MFSKYLSAILKLDKHRWRWCTRYVWRFGVVLFCVMSPYTHPNKIIWKFRSFYLPSFFTSEMSERHWYQKCRKKKSAALYRNDQTAERRLRSAWVSEQMIRAFTGRIRQQSHMCTVKSKDHHQTARIPILTCCFTAKNGSYVIRNNPTKVWRNLLQNLFIWQRPRSVRASAQMEDAEVVV